MTAFKKGNKSGKGGKKNPAGSQPSKEQQGIKKANRQIAKTYQPTPDERAAEEAVRTRMKRTPRVKASVEENGVHLLLNHPKPYYGCFLLMKALGTFDPDFYAGIIPQLARASTQAQNVDEVSLNFMVSVIKGIEPKD
jgi:hypothetical protein